MSLDYVLQQFDAIGPMGARHSIKIDQTFIGSAEIATILRSALDVESLTIDTVTETISRTAERLELFGTTTLNELKDVQVSFLAREREGELSVVLELQLPGGWSFSNVLPNLPSRTGTYQSTTWGAALPEPHFLKQLSLGAGRLIVSSEAYFDERYACDVVPGLNFVGELYPFSGALRTVGSLVKQDDPIPLVGPLKEFRKVYDPMVFLGARLKAPLALGTSNLGPLTLNKSFVYLKAAVDEFQQDPVVTATQAPGIYLLVDAELGGRPVEMIGKYEYSASDSELSLHGRFSDFAVAGFSSLSQTVGVEGFDDDMPEDFPAPEGISLTEFGTTLDLDDASVTALMVGIGSKTNWELFPDVMTLKEVAFTFFVRNPFDRARTLTTTVAGLLAFKKFSLAAFGELPAFRIGAGLPAGETLPLGDVIESFLPGETDLPPFTITRLRATATPKEKAFFLDAAIEDLLSIPVGATAFEVTGLSVLVDYSKARGRARGLVTAQMAIADAVVALSGEVNNGLTLAGSLSNFELKKFWSLVTNGEALPDEVPDIVFETLSFRINTKTGAFSAFGDASVEWDPLTEEGSLKTNVQFSLNRNVTGEPGSRVSSFNASLSVQGQGPVPVAEGLALKAFNLLFSYQTGGSWQLSGGVTAELVDTVLDLQAGYEATQGIQKIKFRAMASPTKTLIDLDGVGSYSFAQFDLLLDRRSGEGGKKKTYFDLRLASTLEIDSLFKLGGYLGISSTAEGKKALVFKPNTGSTTFKIDFPTGEGLGFQGELFEVGLVKESVSAGWSFTGTTILGFTGISGGLAQVLPSKVNAMLVAGKTEARLSAVNVSGSIDFALPRANGKDLGKVVIQLTELGIAVKPQLGMVLEAGLGLPAELNTYLGAQMFRVYQQGNPLTMARTRFTISGTGVAMQFLSSPFTGANTVVVNNEAWFDVDFGQYGAVSFKMPTFVYDGVSQYFEAGGGLKVTRPLALPLAPLKLFLEACGSKAMADIFPDKLPIEGLDLVDKNNDLKVDELVTFLKKAGGVPNEVVTALKQTGKVLNRFPDGFKQYLKIEVPEQLEFKFGFSPAGRISLGMLAPKKPVRVLFPSVVQSYVPMPGLTGIEVRKFSVGTLLSGSLFYGEVDALIDQFDLPSLAVSLMLPRDESFPLPTSDQLQRRIILDDVFCIIPVSQGLPVPLPIFYDELGFEYLGIEGLGLQAHVGFPKPQLDGAAAVAVFQAFSAFFNDRKALLDPNTPPGGVELAFNFHDEFLQAPEYLGAGLLGTKGKNVKVGTWKYIAALMNFGKTFSINDCIGSIPIENRVGSAEYKFAFLKFDADWLLTTPAEFRKGAFQRLELSESDRDDFMTVLPSVASTPTQGQTGNEEGLVAFVRGEVDLEFLRLEAAFGIAASGAMGFNTGFKLGGTFGVSELELSGAVMVNAPLATDVPATQVLPAATVTPSAAQGVQALSFNGKDTWVEIAAADSLVLPEYTIELWIRSAKDQGGEWADIFGIDTRKGGLWRNYFLAVNSKSGFYHHRFTDSGGGNSGPPNTPNGTVSWGQWQHVALTNDGVTAKTYVDGKELASGPVNGALVTFKDSVWVGKVSPQGVPWKGEVAEIRVWKRARSAAEISGGMFERMAADRQDLVSLYRFEEDTGTRAIDLCGRNHGTLTKARFVPSELRLRNPGGVEKQASAAPVTLRHDGLVLNGESDSAFIAQSDRFKTGQYTIEAWVRPDKDPTGSWQCIWGGSGKAPKLFVSNNGIVSHRCTARVKTTSVSTQSVQAPTIKMPGMSIPGMSVPKTTVQTTTSEQVNVLNTGVGVLRFGEWNHLAVTNDGKTCTVFVNGVLSAQGGMPGELVSEAASVNVGRSGDASAQAWFRGSIDDLRYWSVARTAEQISDAMNLLLTGQEAGLVAYYNMDHTAGTQLVDLGANKLHGVVIGGQWALAAAPATQKRAAIQLQGHTHLKVAGRQVMRGDLKLVDDQFWFSGQLDLFPKDWPLSVTGSVEGMVSKQRFYLQGETRNALFGLALSQSRVVMSNDQLRLEGRWLGAYLVLDVSWDKNDPVFKGSVGFKASPRLDFGAVRIGGVKVANNVSISIDVLADVSVVISRQGFSGDITARFKINGKGFELRMGVDIPPADFEQLINWIKQKIIDAPEKYLEHLFADAATWLKNVGSGAIDFAKDSGEAIGKVLSSGYKVSKEGAATLMKGANYATEQVGAALSKGYKATEQEATAALKSAGYAAEQVGNALKSAYSTSVEQAVKLLKGADYAADQVGNALKSAYGTSAEEAAKLLKGAGYAADQVGNALKSAYGTSAEQAAKLLKGAGYAADQVGNALKSAYGTSAEEAAKLLKGADYAADQVGNALKSAYGTSSEQAAKFLKGAGYAADQVGNALKSAYGTSAEEAAKLLKGAGYAADQVGNALKVGWNSSADAIGKALKGAGYGVNEVGNYLKSGFNLGADALSKTLKGAGYASDEISKLFKSLGGEFSKAASKLDPTKW
ncbi:LamG domain-containing protein [Pyxidicoccus trucidator]|uniref:LamG domain-containing protein n=1 Tax=Pyxidicoccus trucidator TaxID=2709662 RepID=UPI0013D934AF|nr:LamG domain-containing protein [Pyxidicoccus trucidator]